MADQRPDPDLLVKRALDSARQEKRGKLKIYLGAAPGVGKTYTMLQDAIAKRTQGLDVIVGVVESHSRQEIENLLAGLEVLPRRVLEYHCNSLEEFDIDAALKRNPAVILVDEMAHTNAPGSRHTKRWQDIKEILYHGIDVYTTLNVQHVESLNDVVAQISHIQVKETVPDSALELANTIELVDLPPEDLLKRLQEGKIYLPEQIELARENYFRKGNLIALRELALRETAARVESEVLLYRQDQGIKQIWATKEKILVCIGSGTDAIKLIRAALRMTRNMLSNNLQKIEWLAVHIDTPQSQVSEEQRHKIVQNLRLAEQLGAETHVLTGFDVVKEIIDFCRKQNITQIVISKKIRPRWKDFFFKSLADELIRQSDDIDVHVITSNGNGDKPQKLKFQSKKNSLKIYISSLVIISIITAINCFVFSFIHVAGLVMLYLLGIALVALHGRVGPSILASLTSVLALDFLFIDPRYSFAIASIGDALTLMVMFFVSQVISYLVVFARRQLEVARRAENYTASLHELSRRLVSAQNSDELLKVSTQYLMKMFNSKVIVLLSRNNQLVVWDMPGTAIKQILTSKEQAIAQWVYERGEVAGLGTETLADSEALYIPLLISRLSIGVLRIKPTKFMQLFTPEQMHLLEDCANQIALALEVDRLQERSKKLALKNEADRVKGIFLKDISHDLRAPSEVIMHAAGALMESGKHLNEQEIKEIAKNIYSELDQLSHMTNNILKMVYFEARAMRVKKGKNK